MLIGTGMDDTVNVGPGGATFANASIGTAAISLANVQKVKFSGAGGGNVARRAQNWNRAEHGAGAIE